jgi:hypothetical protein
MAALSALRSDLQRRFQDKNGGALSATPANLYLNLACEDFVNDVQPMSREYGFYVTAYQFRYDLPTDYIHARAMMWYQQGTAAEIPYLSPQEFKAKGYLDKRIVVATPEAYTLLDGDLYLGPAPSTSSATTTLGTTMTALTTSMVLASSDSFHSPAGIVLCESEQIAYQSNTTSTDTLGLCLRAQGGTTAAGHTSSVAVKRLDLQMTYAFSHTYMSADTDAPAFSSRYHRLIVLLALHFALKQFGLEDEAANAYEQYNTAKLGAKREFRRQVRDISNRRVRSSYS